MAFLQQDDKKETTVLSYRPNLKPFSPPVRLKADAKHKWGMISNLGLLVGEREGGGENSRK